MNETKSGAWRRLAWLPAAVVLAGALLVQGLGEWREAPPSVSPQLAKTINDRPGGWTSEAVPLGANEFLVNEVEKILNYDDFINREYQRGEQRFGLYVAYWGPGKMPTQLVASHTPDRCWSENGWNCREMRFRQNGIFPGIELRPAEWRLFDPPQGGAPTYVLYWHLVDGEAYDYGARSNAVPDPMRWFRGALQEVMHGRREQYFIRLTSTTPFEDLWTDPGFRQVVESLAGLGKARPI